MTLIAYARRKRAAKGCLSYYNVDRLWASRGLQGCACVDDDPERGSAAVRLAFPSSNHFYVLALASDIRLFVWSCLLT